MTTNNNQPGRAPLPVEMEAENVVHAAERQRLAQQNRHELFTMFLRNGYSRSQAEAELRQHDQRASQIENAMQSAVTNTAPADPEAAEGPPAPRDHSDSDPHRSPEPRRRQEPQDEPEMRMPVMPGSFSRALSSPAHWAKAVGLAALAGGAVFAVVITVLHFLFGTAEFLTWPTGIVGGVLALPAFLGVFTAASREVREWVRVGGPKPIRWR